MSNWTFNYKIQSNYAMLSRNVHKRANTWVSHHSWSNFIFKTIFPFFALCNYMEFHYYIWRYRKSPNYRLQLKKKLHLVHVLRSDSPGKSSDCHAFLRILSQKFALIYRVARVFVLVIPWITKRKTRWFSVHGGVHICLLCKIFSQLVCWIFFAVLTFRF